NLMAFDKLRGTHPWKLDKLHDRDLSTPVAVHSRYLAVGDFQGQVHIINSDDGTFAARQPTDGSAIKGVPLVLKAGVVVQTINGGVFSFRFE
ncbi:MAG: outer membrane protein assembly factor BamB, partial [Sulfuricella sp.]|nr:outer membrane protein assembly factor BamB [Sulfuricella sp.]